MFVGFDNREPWIDIWFDSSPDNDRHTVAYSNIDVKHDKSDGQLAARSDEHAGQPGAGQEGQHVAPAGRVHHVARHAQVS